MMKKKSGDDDNGHGDRYFKLHMFMYFGIIIQTCEVHATQILKEKSTNQNKSLNKLSSIFLGILILIFGFINLFNGSLILISLVAIVIGGGLIIYSLSQSNIKNVAELNVKPKRIKKETIKKKSNWSFWLYALGIPGGLIGIVFMLETIL